MEACRLPHLALLPLSRLLVGGMLALAVTIAEAQSPCKSCDEVLGATKLGAFSVEPIYTGDVFSNAHGGISTKDATRYLALMELGLTVDFEMLDVPLPGRFFLLAQNTHGRGLTDDFIGDTLVISNIDASRNITQVSEYWWEFASPCDGITLRLGKQELNTEFAFIETAGDFVQSTFGLSPSTAFPTFPNQSMAAVALIDLADHYRLKAGIWDAFGSGSSWGFSGNDSFLVATELEVTYSIAGGKLPGTFAVGAFYESSGEIDGQPISAVHEYIVQVEQVVYLEQACGNCQQGLSIFCGYYPRFPGKNKVDESIGDSLVAGLVYTGLMQGRDADSIGIGLAWAELFRGGTNEESIIELYYRIEATSRVSIQPDLQYVATPSGIFRDALALGVRLQVHW